MRARRIRPRQGESSCPSCALAIGRDVLVGDERLAADHSIVALVVRAF